MLAFILRRLIQVVIVMVVVALIAFMLFQYVGDPVQLMLGQDARPAQRMQLHIDLGLDRSFIVQFWHFLVNAVHGNFGLSLQLGAKVSRLMVSASRRGQSSAWPRSRGRTCPLRSMAVAAAR